MLIAPDDLQRVVSRVAQVRGVNIVGNRFGAQNSNARNFVDALGARAFEPHQLEGQPRG